MADKIYIQNDDQKIELTGAALTKFLADQEAMNAQMAEQEAIRAAALAKKQQVLEKLGLTADEAAALLS
jgi:hypothetical protein